MDLKKRKIKIRPLEKLLASLCLICPVAAIAAEFPDAGRTLQEMTPPIEIPRSSDIELQYLEPSPRSEAAGPAVSLDSVVFEGNTHVSSETLLGVIGEVRGREFDINEIAALADRVTGYYRLQGYPFARALLPQQSLDQGQLKILIVEGRYGQVQAIGSDGIVDPAQAFLAPLKRGDVITAKALERALLLLDDQPGVKVVPIIRPGQDLGAGDLEVRVQNETRYAAEISSDNHGNRYTGEYRVNGQLVIESPFRFGDRLQVRGVYTSEDLWLGSIKYDTPIGARGLRARVGYTHTDYSLGKEFAALDAVGYAKISTIGFSFPMVRSKSTNVTFSTEYQYKKLEDEYGFIGASDNKSSRSLPVSVRFDHIDSLLDGGITYGSVSWAYGRMNLDEGLRDADVAGIDGGFNKVNFDAARLQTLPGNLQLYAQVSMQFADGNLDSSEHFGLGSVNGVRAYPSGEGYGDEGWLARMELRYRLGGYTPFLLYDEGRIRINDQPWLGAGDNNHRHLAGAGFGLKVLRGGWSSEAAVAWRTRGGDPESDSRDHNPAGWFSMAYRF
jgi:hemolysin activation/secretion protein